MFDDTPLRSVQIGSTMIVAEGIGDAVSACGSLSDVLGSTYFLLRKTKKRYKIKMLEQNANATIPVVFLKVVFACAGVTICCAESEGNNDKVGSVILVVVVSWRVVD